MRVDREMNQDKAVRPDPMSDRAELLNYAGRQALRTTDTRNLRRLIVRLKTACEAARLATLRTMRHTGGQSGMDIAYAQRFGFADLFAALRRARS
jgi:hypothetical protein